MYVHSLGDCVEVAQLLFTHCFFQRAVDCTEDLLMIAARFFLLSGPEVSRYASKHSVSSMIGSTASVIIHMHTHTHTLPLMHTHPHTPPHAHPPTHPHTHTHMHTHTHPHPHSVTHYSLCHYLQCFSVSY